MIDLTLFGRLILEQSRTNQLLIERLMWLLIILLNILLNFMFILILPVVQNGIRLPYRAIHDRQLLQIDIEFIFYKIFFVTIFDDHLVVITRDILLILDAKNSFHALWVQVKYPTNLVPHSEYLAANLA